jgi:hypothetical protein
MAEELKKLLKTSTNPKKEPTFLFIEIREAKKVEDLTIKDKKNGIVELRVHTSDESLPKWYITGYLVNLKNLKIKIKEVKNKHDIQEILRNPFRIGNPAAKQLLTKLNKDYGGIIPDGRDKLYWKTERFKKKKDPFQVKRKAM